jgi:SpoVK/Ycf46/Vps4 family AAA+-type ATPase
MNTFSHTAALDTAVASVSVSNASTAAVLRTPGFELARAEDLACAQLVLEAMAAYGPRFGLRANINDVLLVVAPHMVWTQAAVSKLQTFMGNRCADQDAWKGCAELDAQDFITRHMNWTGTLAGENGVWYYLDEFVKPHAKELTACFDVTQADIKQRLAKVNVTLLDNAHLLSKVLGLTSAEHWVLCSAALAKYKRDVRSVLVDCKVTHSLEAYQQLERISGVAWLDIQAALKPGSRLEMLGLMDSPIVEGAITDLGDFMRLSDRLLPPLLGHYTSEAQLMAVFTKPASQPRLKLTDYPHIDADARYLKALLGVSKMQTPEPVVDETSLDASPRKTSAKQTITAAADIAAKAAAAENPVKGINILIYGPPGTGKTELAKLLANEAQCELYEVESTDNRGASLTGRDRYRSLQISQAFLKGRANTVLLFDEVEDVFPPATAQLIGALSGSSHDDDERGPAVSGKAWVNQTLENNPVPTMWVCNNIKQIDPAYLRRFQYHLELRNPPAHVRENIVRKHLAGIDLSEAFIEKLASKPTLSPAQIESASRFVRLVGSRLDESAEALIERQLDASNKAMGIKQTQVGRVSVTGYELDYLNTECQFPLEKIIASLKRKQHGTLCFYGLPGTGKTALAEHIANSIEKPLMIKRASDLVSKFVGETEQNMAEMFAEAQREGAVLLLDEADSFLQNRQMAQRNFEVSEVNEMLQGMERFEGIFICTTNLMDRIDEAALRRFSFKIKFLPLKPNMREKMFVTQALGDDASKLKPLWKTRLEKLRLLAPGDFAVVKRQAVLLGEDIEPEMFLKQLEQEHAAKPDIKFDKPIGFN